MAPKAFDLLGLPREIRDDIYKEYLLLCWETSSASLSRPYAYVYRPAMLYLFRRTYSSGASLVAMAALLSVSKQVKLEVSEAIYCHAQHIIDVPCSHRILDARPIRARMEAQYKSLQIHVDPYLPRTLHCSLRTLELQSCMTRQSDDFSRASWIASQLVGNAVAIFPALCQLAISIVASSAEQVSGARFQGAGGVREFLEMELPADKRAVGIRRFDKIVVVDEGFVSGLSLHGQVDVRVRPGAKMRSARYRWIGNLGFWSTLSWVRQNRPDLLVNMGLGNILDYYYSYSISEYQERFERIIEAYKLWDEAGRQHLGCFKRISMELQAEAAVEDICSLFELE